MIAYVVCFCLLHLNTVWSGRAEHVRGSVGDTIILPCHYTVHKDPHYMCWGRGKCPSSSCNNVIITTDGSKVTLRKSDKYSLPGDITQGNVSLTITNVTEEDEGMYCCRVKIPGLFNDLLGNIDVQINSGSASSIFTTFPVKNTNKVTMKKNENLPSKTLAVCEVIAVVLFTILMSLILYRWKCYKAIKKTDSKTSVVNMEVLGSAGNQASDNIYT
ncbi:T-cell immunoglobulin and mucin domain-containing protein 4-like isoform X3 [Aquarana catesbeiana]|uniref:T-cell immunoglobulin and mucin domain-containing protein 4-like isoform X3 n=1 Tax=Aquarana catesbeiana TaxID=8400 RepID=UPI003CC9906B